MSRSVRIGDLVKVTDINNVIVVYRISGMDFGKDQIEKGLSGIISIVPISDSNDQKTIQVYPNQVYYMEGGVFTLEFMESDLKQEYALNITVQPLVPFIPRVGTTEPLPIRGLHLDPARRRLSCDKVLEIIDRMNMYGLNVLHLHMTDDQGIGLDIETINFYGHGGWTIQEQMKIADACERYNIDIVPEVDIPGHTVALRSIIERGVYEPSSDMGLVTEGLLREEDLPIMLRIFEEFVQRFKVKKYIHMGGDETRGAKRPYFEKIVTTVCDWAKKKELTVIAWEDILGKVEDIPDNMVIQKWRSRPYPQISKGLDKIGPGRIIYSDDYYLDTSPDPFTMFRKNIDKVKLGCVACSWGELIGMENIDGALYPSIAMLGARWNMLTDNPEEALKMYYDNMIWPEISTTWNPSSAQNPRWIPQGDSVWKRKQWTGFLKKNDQPQPRSSFTPVSRPLTREDDMYPNCSKFLVDMVLDIYDRMLNRNIGIPPEREHKYKVAFNEAGADQKLVDDLFNQLRVANPNIKTIKTAMRRLQRSHEAEEQVYYKNGLRMVLRELLRTPE